MHKDLNNLKKKCQAISRNSKGNSNRMLLFFMAMGLFWQEKLIAYFQEQINGPPK